MEEKKRLEKVLAFIKERGRIRNVKKMVVEVLILKVGACPTISGSFMIRSGA